MSIFERRKNLKPYEYPQLIDYVTAMRKSHWLVEERTFASDIGDFNNRVNETEMECIKRCALAISQVEIAPKTFRPQIYERFPKPEIWMVWVTFWESEVRHLDAYSHLLDLLWLQWDFEKLIEVPCIKKRIDYLNKSIANTRNMSNEDYVKALILFSLLIEWVSLFWQFLILQSFKEYKNLFNDINATVWATSAEEQLHWMFWCELILIIQEEYPDFFNDTVEKEVIEMCKEAFIAEWEIIDWIFEKWELEWISKYDVKEFLKNRINISLNEIGMDNIFDVDAVVMKKLFWFENNINTTVRWDFLNARSNNYTKHSFSCTENDLFLKDYTYEMAKR